MCISTTPVLRALTHSLILSGNTPTYASIPSDAVRKAIKEMPQNIGMLARMAVGKLAKAAESKGALSSVEQESVLASAALLSRLLPILYESEHEHNMVETIFWKGQMPGDTTGAAAIPLAPGLMDSALVLMYHQGFTVSTATERSAVCYGGNGCRQAGRQTEDQRYRAIEAIKIIR